MVDKAKHDMSEWGSESVTSNYNYREAELLKIMEKNTDKQTFLLKSEKIFVIKKIFVGKKGEKKIYVGKVKGR